MAYARKPLAVVNRMEKRLAKRKGDVFLRADFGDLGSYNQVGLALRSLVSRGALLRLGQGVYVRAKPSVLDGSPVPVKGIRILMQEALKRLGVRTAPTSMERDYIAGRSTQVPTGRLIGVDRRVRRKLGYNGMSVSFELV